jgi:hypothetical protein
MLLQLGVDPVRIDEDFLSETSTMMAETSVESANATISSAAIVFAHSIADDILFDLCKLVSDIEPAPWIDICQQRKVSLADVCNNTSDEIIRSILEEYFVQLKRESLMKKADLFLRALKPGLDEEDITRRFNRQELARIDAVRHECVHDSRFTVEKAAAIDDVKTLEEVVDVFITLLCKRYGIERNRDKAADRLTKGSCLS